VTKGGGFAAIILAAGHGTRMKSSLPKMLHEVAGRPLLEHVLRAVLPLEPVRTLVVVGHGAERVRERFRDMGVSFVLQERQLGTGHALRTALPELARFSGDVMVLNGDAPLVTSETLGALRQGHRDVHAGMTMLTYRVADPTGLGRIVRDDEGRLERIVEEKDASAAEREIDEIGPGLYIFDRHVAELADRLGNSNAQGEFYITEMPGLYLEAGLPVHTVLGKDETGQLVGVNDRAQLAQAERILRQRIRRRWLAEGVTMLAPEQTFIDDTVELARDVLLEPGVVLRGAVRLGEGVRVGAYSVLADVDLGPGETVLPHTVRSGPNGALD
jgi:bifunctional UDP-N-acetylglucosamine pyrophosphorylase/glucosamine-1-phosphate N-acetyltransferase